jgi:hypothetical protein
VQVQVLLPVLFTRVSEVFITSEILIFLSFFPIRKDTTMQAYKDLVKALPGLKEDMPRAFYMLAELFDYGSFDICRSDDKYIIPYIMNDAVECYLTVENAVLKGDYHSEEEIISASLVLGSEKGYGLILHQQDNVMTLWFDNLHVHEACFKYHEIGHFWVKGQEQWRMLVYMVGTIADKYMYMGKEYCNETECFIQSLIYFAPFRRWTPVPGDLMEYHFPARVEGIDIMEELCREVSDTDYLKLIARYRANPCEKTEKLLSRHLADAKRVPLYQYIYKLVIKASKDYPERNYGNQINERIKEKRKALEKELLQKGYTGKYPVFSKKNTTVRVMEEQPYVTAFLEWDDYKYKQQLMISECSSKKYDGINAGFFKGIGRHGHIVQV